MSFGPVYVHTLAVITLPPRPGFHRYKLMNTSTYICSIVGLVQSGPPAVPTRLLSCALCYNLMGRLDNFIKGQDRRIINGSSLFRRAALKHLSGAVCCKGPGQVADLL